MCNPGNSSKIYQEQKELLESHPDKIKPLVKLDYFQKDEKEFYNWHKDKKIWSAVYKWLPQVKKLYFTGGEPTLIQKNWELIKSAETKGYAKNIHLIFNINCTHVPDKFIKIFSNFQTVYISLSIDGIGEVNDYIRHPSKWAEVEKNIIKILKHKKTNVNLQFSPVVQIYNILNLTDLFQWVDNLCKKHSFFIEKDLLMCTSPRFLNIAFLPKNIKMKALSKIEKYENSCNKNGNLFLSQLHSLKKTLKSNEEFETGKMMMKFHKYTALLDQKRSNSFENTFPELNKLLNEDGRWNS